MSRLETVVNVRYALAACAHAVAVSPSLNILSSCISTAAARKYFEHKARLNFDPATGERLIRNSPLDSTPSSSPALNPLEEAPGAPTFERLADAALDGARDAMTSE